MTSNINLLNQNLNALKNYNYLSIKGDEIIEDSYLEIFKKFINRGYKNRKDFQIVNYVNNLINSSNESNKELITKLSNRAISYLKYNKTLKKDILLLDRLVEKISKVYRFQIKKNKELFKKWKLYGFDSSIFYKYPKFSDFLFNSNLAAQVKVTNDLIKIIENEPAILVEGKYEKFSDIEKRFGYKYSYEFHEIFVYEKDTNEVFTYLDTKMGLVQHHPYVSCFKPISKISNDEYIKLLDLGKTFNRKSSNLEKKHVLQIVTSNIDKDEKNSYNITKFLKSKHPYFRLIDSDKNVYIIGYGNWIDSKIYSFSNTTRGRFRSPDIWEYKRCEKKFVTNIAIDEEEAKRFKYFCIKYMNDDLNFGRRIAFNFFDQNCTSFVRNALKYSLDFKLDSQASLFEIITFIVPDIIANTYKNIESKTKLLLRKTAVITPSIVKTLSKYVYFVIEKIIKLTFTFFVSSITFLLGAYNSKKGRVIKNPDKVENFLPPLSSITDWVTYSRYKIDAPAKLQYLQKQMHTTKKYKKPLKLAIT
ncbi:MAG: hypothetical protein K1060chlam5_00832 [Candidatus Anoxychlamydiales bacterium]|nr:hypothetical protein [Candidatus Anoxychlamydiales bacterium]